MRNCVLFLYAQKMLAYGCVSTRMLLLSWGMRDADTTHYEKKIADLQRHPDSKYVIIDGVVYAGFMRYMTKINSAALEKYILSVNGNRKLTHKEMMYVKIYCHGLVGLACEWILGQIDTTPEEIAEVYAAAGDR